MSAQNMADAFAPIDAQYRNDVLARTWGHLAAKKHRLYRGWILFAIPGYDSGTPCIIESEFKGLDDSPWLYDAMWDFCADRETVPHDENGLNPEPGVYRFTGTIRNYEFNGAVTKIDLSVGVDEPGERAMKTIEIHEVRESLLEISLDVNRAALSCADCNDQARKVMWANVETVIDQARDEADKIFSEYREFEEGRKRESL